MNPLLKNVLCLVALLFLVASLSSCGKRGRTGHQGIPGVNGSNGKDGVNGSDGISQDFQLSGQLGTYLEKGEDLRAFNLTCMLGDSSPGKPVLRIITGSGGFISVEKGSTKEAIYFPANKAVFLYAKSNGTYKVVKDGTSKVKACNI